MIRSMTGFGTTEGEVAGRGLRLEVKTVNHRFLNLRISLPRGFEPFEPGIREWLGERFSRGHVSYSLSVEREGDVGAGELELDMERAREVAGLLRELRDELDLGGSIAIADVLRFEGIVRRREPEPVSEAVGEETLRRLTREAGDEVVAMREAEGRRLADDMAERLAAMEGHLAVVEDRAPGRLVRERDRMRDAVAELAGDVEVDDERLAREIAHLAEKWDINEEIVRFRSHIAQFREALAGDSGEPVGKRLGFLVQEMHREANTIGAKANDEEISRAGVGLKEEVERLREQVENVE